MIKWMDSYSVSHKEIDDQHKELIDILREVEKTIKKEDFSYLNLVHLIDRLEGYVRLHFDYEEDLMLKTTYPHIMEHTNEHNAFRYKLQKTYVLDIEKPKEFYYEMSDYLSNWLTDHILHVDQQLGSYLLARSGQ